MGKKLLLKFLGVMLIVIDPFSQALHAGVITDDKFIDFFNLKMSTSVITLLCTDEDFINDLGLTKEICIYNLSEHIEYCKLIVGPLLPEVKGEEFSDEQMGVFRVIGGVYEMCFKSYLLERVVRQPGHRDKPAENCSEGK